MSRSCLHVRELIAKFAALLVMAWIVGSPTPAPDVGSAGSILLDLGRGPNHSIQWIQPSDELVSANPAIADLEEENRSRENRNLDVTDDFTDSSDLNPGSSTGDWLELNRDPRANSPGARRGPPPRMPPV